ncbi:MAG: SpoIIE family protein phosphatase, partial [Moorella sp. (in: Bacteria)]|nr:SpoIIE family protein phosphatase [Moorella sp. (in: firmicutes)]
SERLAHLALKYHDLPAQAFVDAIVAETQAYNPQQPFQDDVTLFVVQRKGNR